MWGGGVLLIFVVFESSPFSHSPDSLAPFPYVKPSPDIATATLNTEAKLHSLVYDALPPPTVVTGYTIDLKKLPANPQPFFLGAQMAVNL